MLDREEDVRLAKNFTLNEKLYFGFGASMVFRKKV